MTRWSQTMLSSPLRGGKAGSWSAVAQRQRGRPAAGEALDLPERAPAVQAEALEGAGLGQRLQLVLAESAPPDDVREIAEGGLPGSFASNLSPVPFPQPLDVAQSHANRELGGIDPGAARTGTRVQSQPLSRMLTGRTSIP